jgi:hypothetical protein
VTWQGIAQPCQPIIATPMSRVRWSWLRLAVNPLPAVRKSEMEIQPGANLRQIVFERKERRINQLVTKSNDPEPLASVPPTN